MRSARRPAWVRQLLLRGAVACATVWVGCADDAPPGAPWSPTPGILRAPAPEQARLGGIRFEDVGSEWGIEHERSETDGSGVDRMAAGVCAMDVDGRPPLDLVFTRRAADGGPLLYVGHGYGDYVDETTVRGLDPGDDALGCLAFDADADGDHDLLLTGLDLLKLYENVGGELVAAASRLEVGETAEGTVYVSAAAGDLDGDADVDLFVGGLIVYAPDTLPGGRDADCPRGTPCLYEISYYDHAPNLLLVQDESGVYRDTSSRHPGAIDRPLPTLVVGAVDLDLDGALEVFIGNDFTLRDRVYWRGVDGEFFFEMGDSFGLAVGYRGTGIDSMGWSSGDLDGDEIADHVVTGFEGQSSAVFLSGGDFFFEDSAPTVGVLDRVDSFRWAAGLADFDLDGDLDLVEATGHVFPTDRYDTVFRGPERQPNNYFENDGEGRLVAVDPVQGDALALRTDSRGLVIADLDDDGRPDLVFGDAVGPARVFRNVGRGGHWLRVRLDGSADNRAAIGARVRVIDAAGDVYVREQKAGEGYAGSFDPRLLFGLPRADDVDVEVTWPGGPATRVEGVAVDSELVLRLED